MLRPTAKVLEHAVIGTPVERVADAMTEAEDVVVLGCIPHQLARALLAPERLGRRPPSSRATYVTAAAERVHANRTPWVLGEAVRRWQLGLDCFGNWSGTASDGPGTATDRPHIVRTIDNLLPYCLVTCRSGGRATAVFSLVPVPAVTIGERASIPSGDLLVTEVAPPGRRRVDERLRHAEHAGHDITPRYVACAADRTHTRGRGARRSLVPDDFRPIVTWVAPTPPPPHASFVVPIAVVALRTPEGPPEGPGLLLKYRHRFNARNDFDTYALPSEWVMEEHLALASGIVAPVAPSRGPAEAGHDGNRNRAADWCTALGERHEAFELPEAAVRAAAQREVFATCGLDIESGRFAPCGRLLVEPDDGSRPLGFLAYRVDLRRDTEVDEAAQALAWNPDLHFVAAHELGEYSRRSFNRLLGSRMDWVRSVVLA